MQDQDLENLLRAIMDVERKCARDERIQKTARREELKQLIDRSATEAEEHAPPQG